MEYNTIEPNKTIDLFIEDLYEYTLIKNLSNTNFIIEFIINIIRKNNPYPFHSFYLEQSKNLLIKHNIYNCIVDLYISEYNDIKEMIDECINMNTLSRN
jgi:hypothetical protein